MTARTMFARLAYHLGATSRNQMFHLIGVHESLIRRAEQRGGMNLTTLRQIHQRCGVPIGLLAEWWLEDDSQFSLDGMRKRKTPQIASYRIRAALLGAEPCDSVASLRTRLQCAEAEISELRVALAAAAREPEEIDSTTAAKLRVLLVPMGVE